MSNIEQEIKKRMTDADWSKKIAGEIVLEYKRRAGKFHREFLAMAAGVILVFGVNFLLVKQSFNWSANVYLVNSESDYITVIDEINSTAFYDEYEQFVSFLETKNKTEQM